MKLGASRGPHWVWEGTPEPEQADIAVNYIHLGPTRTSRTPCYCLALRALVRGRDECPSSEGRTQPRFTVLTFHRVFGVGGLL